MGCGCLCPRTAEHSQPCPLWSRTREPVSPKSQGIPARGCAAGSPAPMPRGVKEAAANLLGKQGAWDCSLEVMFVLITSIGSSKQLQGGAQPETELQHRISPGISPAVPTELQTHQVYHDKSCFSRLAQDRQVYLCHRAKIFLQLNCYYSDLSFIGYAINIESKFC